MDTLESLLPRLKPLLDASLFLVWVTLYLAGACWIGHHRWVKLSGPGGSGSTGYRVDRDLVFQLGVFAVGLVLLILCFLGFRALAYFP